MRWSRVMLPGNASPVTLSRLGNRLLVGGRDVSADVAPQLLLRTGGHWTSIRLHPSSYYAYRAQFRSVITDGRRIYAFGDAPGGAHFNPRWTTWAGTVQGVREYPQTFETFGGWGAGGLTAMTLSDGKPEIVGSWSSGHGGLDIVSWSLNGHTWVRGTATGTALASSNSALNVIRALGTDSGGAIIAGAVTTLGHGDVHLVPAVWRQSPVTGAWTRVDLPATGPGQATDAECTPQSCLAAGYDGGRLALWRIVGTRAQQVSDIPLVRVTTSAVALVGPAAAPTPEVLTTSHGRAVLLRPGSPWTSTPGPTGTAQSWVWAGGRMYVITAAPDGTTSLWAGPPAHSP